MKAFILCKRLKKQDCPSDTSFYQRLAFGTRLFAKNLLIKTQSSKKILQQNIFANYNFEILQR